MLDPERQTVPGVSQSVDRNRDAVVPEFALGQIRHRQIGREGCGRDREEHAIHLRVQQLAKRAFPLRRPHERNMVAGPVKRGKQRHAAGKGSSERDVHAAGGRFHVHGEALALPADGPEHHRGRRGKQLIQG